MPPKTNSERQKTHYNKIKQKLKEFDEFKQKIHAEKSWLLDFFNKHSTNFRIAPDATDVDKLIEILTTE